MRVRSGILFILLFFTASFLVGCSTEKPGKAEEVKVPAEVKHLIHPDARNVQINSLNSSGRWQIIYEVEAPYPPRDVLDFIRKNMRDAGFFPDKLGEKGFWSWDEHLNTAATEETYVRQYMSPWSTLQGKEVALVTLQYMRKANEDYGGTLKCYIIYR